MSDPYAVTGTATSHTTGQPTMSPAEIAAWEHLARQGRLHRAIYGTDWPETLARLAAQADAAQNIDATLWPTSQRAIARARAAALSTQPATRTGSQPPAAPQGAPARPSKR